MVPHLTTSLTGPLQRARARSCSTSAPRSSAGSGNQWLEHEVNFYASVDLRNSGFKLAPVDTNLFPGGFNNLQSRVPCRCACTRRCRRSQKLCPDARRLRRSCLRTTRATSTTCRTSRCCGASSRARASRCASAASSPTHRAHGGRDLRAARSSCSSRSSARATASVLDGFDPCAVLLNNDLLGRHPGDPARHRAAGGPAARRGLDHAPQVAATSTPTTAWPRTSRSSSASIRGSSNPVFSQCGKVNFAEKEGEELPRRQRGVRAERDPARSTRSTASPSQPFAIVKADAGTYGMGIMTVKSVDDVRNLNRKTRNKMAVHQGRPAGARGHHPGRRLHLRERGRRGGRAGRST